MRWLMLACAYVTQPPNVRATITRHVRVQWNVCTHIRALMCRQTKESRSRRRRTPNVPPMRHTHAHAPIRVGAFRAFYSREMQLTTEPRRAGERKRWLTPLRPGEGDTRHSYLCNSAERVSSRRMTTMWMMMMGMMMAMTMTRKCSPYTTPEQ